MSTRKNGVAFYMHAGSGNHGCEAIVDSLLRMTAQGEGALSEIRLISCRPQEDLTYVPGTLAEVLPERRMEDHPVWHVLYYAYRRLTGDEDSFARFRLREIAGNRAPRLAVSIGGDNYCYPILLKELMLANRMLNRQGTATMLLGCSIEPSLLEEHPEVREDMMRYRRIIARESITYEALRAAGIPPERLVLCPDPAFALPVQERPLPQEWEEGNTVGINVSPMVTGYEEQEGVTMRSYEALMEHILSDTSLRIALIPHVVWSSNDDRGPLRQLYEKYRETGRVCLIGDAPAEVLKGYISRCRFFVGARTHATIAAYSSGVPTLVVGYSVKARGIARDLFGTEENYVLPVQSLREPGQLIEGFEWLRAHEQEIRDRLTACMPSYREKALLNGEEIRKLYREL
ncbi:MAG: polysaccharide pyruvyl transferase family protein [Eubacteriales bacterium]|nr:polysaccharide pyruvyl transferase family protein [Eubacteriales bacterium]